MTCDLETRGGRRTIDVRRRGSEWEMTLDGRILKVDVTAIGGRLALLIRPPSPDGFGGTGPPSPDGFGGTSGETAFAARSYEVAVERRSNGERIVHISGLAVPVSIVDPREQLVRRRGAAASDSGPRSIVSPMPGRIVKVLVREGDTVAAQQGLVVIEAMKMENELRAPRAGQVTAVKVVEGMSVEGGAVLIVLE
jgi:biotin carboxyl carrier protein